MATAYVTYYKMLGGKDTIEVEYEPTGKWSTDVEQIKKNVKLPFGASIFEINT